MPGPVPVRDAHRHDDNLAVDGVGVAIGGQRHDVSCDLLSGGIVGGRADIASALIVTAAFLHADEVGNGQYLPFIGDFLSFNEIVETLNQQGHKLSVKQIPTEVFATFFPGAAEIAEMFNYFQAHTYLGSDSSDRIALATKIAGRQPTKFSTWARVNFPVQNA